MKENLFFIAILPDLEISREIVLFKILAQTKFGTSGALRSPAHITVIPPFKWEADKMDSLNGVLKTFSAKQQHFYVELNNFGAFKPRVIFVKVEENERLINLQKQLKNLLSEELNLVHNDNRPYHPHMTVATKDLRKAVFPEAWQYFAEINFKRMFLADVLTLMKHNGHNWEVFLEFRLSR